MSYILDALRKAERERQRGVVPTLAVAAMLPEAARRSRLVTVGAIGAVAFIAVSAFVGGLRVHSLQSSAPDVSAPHIVVGAATRAVLHAASRDVMVAGDTPHASRKDERVAMPVERPAVTAANGALSLVAPRAVGNAQANTAHVSDSTVASAPHMSAQGQMASPTSTEIGPLSDLPQALQDGIPHLRVLFHAYSDDPKRRLVEINGKPMREGDELIPGLKLTSITENGMIFSYHGYQFATSAQ